MNWLVNIFAKLAVRRVAYFIAPLLLGWLSNAWWIQDALKSWGLHPDNLSEFTGEIILGITALLALVNEYIAYKRNHHNTSIKEDFANFVATMQNNGQLNMMIDSSTKAISEAGKAIILDGAKRQALDGIATPADPEKIVS